MNAKGSDDELRKNAATVSYSQNADSGYKSLFRSAATDPGSDHKKPVHIAKLAPSIQRLVVRRRLEHRITR
jgi:hypothetical protein